MVLIARDTMIIMRSIGLHSGLNYVTFYGLRAKKKSAHVSFTTQFMSASVKFISARFTVLEINPLCIKFKLQSDVVICHRLRMWSANYTQFVVRKLVQNHIFVVSYTRLTGGV